MSLTRNVCPEGTVHTFTHVAASGVTTPSLAVLTVTPSNLLASLALSPHLVQRSNAAASACKFCDAQTHRNTYAVCNICLIVAQHARCWFYPYTTLYRT